MNTRHDLRSLVDDILSDDTKRTLIGVRQLREELAWIEERVIAQARADGWSWRRIGKLLNVDHTSLSRRFRHVVSGPQLRPAPPPQWGQADTTAWYRTQRDARLRAELAEWAAGPFDLVPW